MKKIYSLVLLGFSFLLMSCNGVGSKDTVVARIGSESLYKEDLDFLTIQNGGNLNSESGKAATERLLFSLAGVSKARSESDSYDSAWKNYESVLKTRLLALTYAQVHLMMRLGYTDEELKKYFDEHRSEFDSAATYMQVRNEVADRYYLFKNQDSLERYIQKSLPGKDEPVKAEILFFEGDSLAVLEMERNFNSGVSVDTLPSVHYGAIVQGREQGIFADSSVVRALFLADSMAAGSGRSFRVQEGQSFAFFALKVLRRIPAVKAKIEDYREEFEKKFIVLRRESMIGMTRELQTNMGDVVIEKMVPKDLHKFYEDNKDKLMTVPGYELYHVAMKDSVVLAKTMVNVKDLESFKAVAATISENKETSENLGYVGRVKRDYALPYGIGMIPALWAELEGKTEGYMSSVIRSASDSLYHSFYVSAVVPAEQKPFDRVVKQLEEMYASDVGSLDPATVLVSENGKPIYTKADIMKVFNAEPGIPYNKETQDNITRTLAQSYVISKKAIEEKVNLSWEYRVMQRFARIEFINSCYSRNSKTTETEKIQIPENLKKFEFFYNRESSYKGLSYEEAVPQIVASLESKARLNEKTVSDMDAWNKANVFFVDSSKAGLVPITTGEGFLALGDSLARGQKFDAAVVAYRRVIDFFAQRDTLFRMAVYNMAQVYSDAQKFNDAVKCYEVFLKIWPDAPEVEKAMFSLGFFLSENLKQNDQALEVLEDFQKRFPKSELKESVDWLVENIKSDGKLAEDLMKKIEAEE